MKKIHFIFYVFLLSCIASTAIAQKLPCYTDEVHARLVAAHPEILQYEADFNKQIKEGIKKINFNKLGRVMADESGNDTFWYDVPVVVHVIHDYNTTSANPFAGQGDFVTDDMIFNDLIDWNVVYAGANPDTSTVIPTFKPYIGVVRIRLHLATIDPNGNATHGITRHRSYLTYIGGDQSKLDDWDPTSYVNIWTVNTMSLSNAAAAAYAYYPSEGAALPYADGVICLFNYLGNQYTGPIEVSKTINHEIGHVFNLIHPWGGTNNPEVSCGDDDVDDTPPTHGHSEEGCVYDHTALYDTDCATNYFKIYSSSVSGVDSLVNYPDTVNAQNIMDYTYCSRMFTKGQVARMHAALNSSVAGRMNLWDSTNLTFTGVISGTDANGNYIFKPRPDLKPIPEYNAYNSQYGTYSDPNLPSSTNKGYYLNRINYFTFPGCNVVFENETWNDTLTSLNWAFSNGAALPTSNSLTTVTNSFTLPGWVTVSMTATGNGTGDTTVVWPSATSTYNTVFVANSTGTPADGYFEEFNGGDVASWPTFNYYNNEFKWQLANVGYYDNSCIEYLGYDSRVIPASGIYPNTGTPIGDFDDMFSIPMDLSTFADTCNLNFYYAGATRGSTTDALDTLEIDYSITTPGSFNTNWTVLKKLTGSDLDNKGALSIPFAPLSQGDWAPETIGIPAVARTSYTTFRFRYKPAGDPNFYYSTGNNFYMDRINFSRIPASASNVKLTSMDVVLAPNPTNGAAYVIIKDGNNTTAQIVVSDITGKEIYTTSQQLSNGEARVEIPHTAISVKGVYMVQTTTGSQVHTQKLIVD